ncbi:MAG TPA: hypothetical protein DHD79_12125 [Firmicutes bacterium]|jgi:hypothetical protein|nr:hypothetical protein [Bacillota bacterium]HAZ22950.1 hypothetical protein [Bacillota bacterium]HBG43125.1 hypothetical protein [Bacillota bacterium]HBL50972.1 hypothetical protein [Bacillota bacterium]HBL68695.1 hypothetical protein [Bacillota bacterium]
MEDAMEFLKLLVSHFVADFVLQGRKIAYGKAQKWRYLVLHLLILTAVTAIIFWQELWENWALLAVSIAWHGIVDCVTARLLRRSLATLLVDQGLHLVGLIGTLLVFGRIPLEEMMRLFEITGDRSVLMVVLTYSFSLFFGSVFVERICDCFDHPLTDDDEDTIVVRREKGASAFIGFVERFLVTTFVFFGQYGAVGFVFAAKSIGKFTEGNESAMMRRFPAYYLVGTLASLAVAVVAGLFLKWQLTGTGL